MGKYIIAGCDLHDGSMLIEVACDREAPETLTFGTSRPAREKLIEELRRRAQDAGGAKIVFAYEASSQGYGLYDDLTEAGITCHVLAPTRLPQTVKSRRQKTDRKDAHRVFQMLRASLLAGNELPAIWVPDVQTRDDREVVRARIDVSRKTGMLRTQIRCLLKRNRAAKPEGVGKAWTNAYLAWLRGLTGRQSPLPRGARTALLTLRRQLECYTQEIERLDRAMARLAKTDRYRDAVDELLKLKGVGLFSAMVFLTEMGHLRRFQNRRQVGAYLGVTPSQYETGQDADRKGHITHHGSSRLRRALCQAEWARVRTDPKEKEWYERLKARNPKRTKIAVVAGMRRLAILMWHRACATLPPQSDAAQPSSPMDTASPLPSPQRGEAPAFATGVLTETDAGAISV